MLANRSWMLTAVAALVGINLLAGCGSSEQKSSQPPTKTAQEPKKLTIRSKPMAPRPKRLDENEPTSSGDLELEAGRQSPPVPSPPPKLSAPSKLVFPPADRLEGAPLTRAEVKSSRPAGELKSAAAEKLSAEKPPMPSPAPSTDASTARTTKIFALPSTEVAGDAEANKAGQPAEPPLNNTEYTVVKVFYGTDRAVSNDLRSSRMIYLFWLEMTVGAALATLFLSILAFRISSSKVIRGSAYAGLVATLLLGAVTTWARFENPLSGNAANVLSSPSVSYGNQRGSLELGACEVSIPKSHEVGQLESPSVLRLEFREDPKRHVVLLDVQPEPAEQFFTDLRACVGGSAEKSAFVFVHGYNITFDEAARRTAQIAYDLKFAGAPILFSWPSQGGMWSYTVDETNVDWTVPHLRQFLADVAKQSGAEKIHLIAHSMGNRALTAAMTDLSFLPESARPTFNEVLLTAPDIDAEVFKNDIAPAVIKVAKRVTLYASSNDEALMLSKKVHGYARAGDSGSQLVVVPGNAANETLNKLGLQ